MAFIGTPLDTRNTFQSLQGKRFDGDGSTTAFTLDVAPSSTLDIEVFVGNVRQDPNSAYTLSGTTLTFTGAPPSGTNNIYVVHQAKSVGTIDVPDLAITTAKLNADAVTSAKIADDSISDEHLDITAITGQTAITSLADTDKFLVSDASDSGNLKYVEKQYLGGGGSFIYLGGINSSNHSANKLQLTQVFADDYRRYKVMGKFQGTGNGANVEFRWLNSSNGELTSNYHTITDGQKSDSSSASNEEWIDWGATKTRMFIDTATGSHIHSFTMDLFPNQNENVDYPTGIFQTQTWDHNSGGNRQRIIQGALYNEVTTSLSGGGIQFESTSGLFGTVNISIWGYKDS